MAAAMESAVGSTMESATETPVGRESAMETPVGRESAMETPGMTGEMTTPKTEANRDTRIEPAVVIWI
jgi:hypothetical protein